MGVPVTLVDAGGVAVTLVDAAGTIVAFGTMAPQNANAVAITGGTIVGITDLAVADGGTGAGTAAAARTNLGLGNVDNTSDANKPVSTAQQTALDLKAPLASPAFTGAASLTQNQNATTTFSVVNTDTTNASSRGEFTVQGGDVLTRYLVVSGTGLFLGTLNGFDFNLQRGGVTIATVQATGLDITGVLKIGGTQVLGAQGAAVADATDGPSAITQLNALLARARAHGWIAT